MVNTMILSFQRGSKAIRHFDNIVDIHKGLPAVIQDLNGCHPLYAGGYPMSLLFAPRKTEQITKIAEGYYQDYDVYFPSEGNLLEAIDILDSYADVLPTNKKFETENAITYTINTSDTSIAENPASERQVSIQVIKRIVGSPEEILQSFDFKNLAYFYFLLWP